MINGVSMLLSRLPGTYVNLLIETIEEWGISSEEVLADTHITLEDLLKRIGMLIRKFLFNYLKNQYV